MLCKKCNQEIADNATVCPACGAAVKSESNVQNEVSEKDWLTSLLLCWFLGYLGIHSFYVGKTGIGVAQLLTAGGCGIWSLIDLITIIMGNYKDAEGKAVVKR